MSTRRNQGEIVGLSLLGLFLELAIIRWLSSEIRIFAYFKNLPLMAAFLGFGAGFWLHSRNERLFPWFPRLICYLVIIISGAAGFGLTHVIFVDPKQFFLLGVGFGDHSAGSIPSLVQVAKALFVIVAIFFLVMAVFAALASKLGHLLNQESALKGYSLNVAGSLLGIITFSVVSFLHLPPFLWLLLLFSGMMYFFRDRLKLTLVYFIAALTFSSYVQFVNPAEWSPYYRLHLSNHNSPGMPNETHLYVNYDGFQVIQDLSPAYLSRFPVEVQSLYSRHYNLPYLLSKQSIESVLILGGGAGNDAAAAIRNNVKHIDVVEIDPAIARIGREIHPEHPYSAPQVHLHIADARSFLQKNDTKYDLIIFATLDSHTVFSSLSSIRLDNFVFTRESLESAAAHLNPDGGIAINFFMIKPWLSQRHLNTLKEVIGERLLAYASTELQEAIILAGGRFDGSRDPGVTIYHPIPTAFTSERVEPVTDDWPFLFLEKREIPFHYLLPLLLILVLVTTLLRGARLKVQHIDWNLFFMGAAFLLIETKAVTTLALIFGSTWMVNSIVFGSVMIVILLANWLIDRRPAIGFPFLYAGLFGAILFNFFFRFDSLNQLGIPLRLFLGGLTIGIPLFFAALIFARAFEEVEIPSLALASNLLGALVGGILEYMDMWIGLRWLNIMALLLYALSFLLISRKLRTRASLQVSRFSNEVP
jgi:SAM-dependent methyltransferase